MSLNTDEFKANLKTVFEATRTGTANADDALDAFLDGFVGATKTFVETASIIYTSGLVAPNGPVTGTFEGSLV